ncbi:MAG TPA: hypothetical protein VF545_13200 [Thermoleophilaceae bacterium]
MLGRVRRLPPAPGWLALALLFAGAALLSGANMLDGVQPNDEGLMLQAADRIAGGQVPYRDFWWYYPPGQPYLLAGLWKLFGPSLLTWRIVRMAADAAVAVLAYRLARSRGPVGLALTAWLVAACAMAFPKSPHPFPIALALALGALLLLERRPALAGALAGACAAWRIEFAAYLALAAALGYAVSAGAVRERSMRLARFAGAALAVALALFAPVVAAAGLGRSWDLLVRYPLVDFARYQSLPFPFDYSGPLNTSSPGGFLSDSAENLLHFYLPLALLVGLAGALVALASPRRRPEPGVLAAAVFALGMAHYLLVRTDLFHTAPLAVMVAVLGAWALGAPAPARAWSRGRGAALLGVAAATAAAGFAWALAEGVDRFARGLGEHTVALDVPVADGVRARPLRAAPLVRAVRYVRTHVPAGEPIYVTGARADLVTSGNPLLYVLAERPNPTRYDIAAPGVVTSAPVQREIVRDLRRARPRVVVRWTAPVTALHEPNRSGRSSGVRILDRYLTRDYRLAARFGYYLLLAPRARGGP